MHAEEGWGELVVWGAQCSVLGPQPGIETGWGWPSFARSQSDHRSVQCMRQDNDFFNMYLYKSYIKIHTYIYI